MSVVVGLTALNTYLPTYLSCIIYIGSYQGTISYYLVLHLVEYCIPSENRSTCIMYLLIWFLNLVIGTVYWVGLSSQL